MEVTDVRNASLEDYFYERAFAFITATDMRFFFLLRDGEDARRESRRLFLYSRWLATAQYIQEIL